VEQELQKGGCEDGAFTLVAGGWRRAAYGVRRATAVCDGGVRRSVRRRVWQQAADRGNRFAMMEEEGVRRQLMF
jgi:hypothetical protein